MANTLKIGFFPGSFRPPHAGHFESAKRASKENDYFFIIGSESAKADMDRGFLSSSSKDIWNIYLKLIKNAKYITSLIPVAVVYEVVNILNNGKFVNNMGKKPRKESVQLASGLLKLGSHFEVSVYSGEEDLERYKSFNTNSQLYTGKNVSAVNVRPTERIGGFKASDLRQALQNKDVKTIEKFLPKEISDDYKEKLIHMMLSSLVTEAVFSKLWWASLFEAVLYDTNKDDLLLKEIYHMPISNMKRMGKNPIMDLSLEYNKEALYYFTKTPNAELLFIFSGTPTALKIKKIGNIGNGKLELDLVSKSAGNGMRPEQIVSAEDDDYDSWLSKFYSSNNWVKQLLHPMNEDAKEQTLTEAVHIEHPEDMIFNAGSSGAMSSIKALRALSKNSKNVSIKWDGKPAIVFGRDDNGFVLTDKSAFSAKKYQGLSRSVDDIQSIMNQRSGERGELVGIYRTLFPLLENIVPDNFRGFFLADLLYSKRPELQNGNYIFQPNTVSYSVDQQSEMGQKVGRSIVGIVIHTFFKSPQDSPIPASSVTGLKEDPRVAIFNTTENKKINVKLNDKLVNNLEIFIKNTSGVVDGLFDKNKLRQMKISDFPILMKRYINYRIRQGNLANLTENFVEWINLANVTDAKKRNLISYANSKIKAINIVFKIFSSIYGVKSQIVKAYDMNDGMVKASIDGQMGHEGYVVSTNSGLLKLIDRLKFSKANFAKNG